MVIRGALRNIASLVVFPLLLLLAGSCAMPPANRGGIALS